MNFQVYLTASHIAPVRMVTILCSCGINLPAIWTDSKPLQPWNDAWGMKAVLAAQSRIISHNFRQTDGADFFFIYFRKAFLI